MKSGCKWIFWSALVIMVITTITVLSYLTGLPLFRATPLLYSVSVIIAVTGLSLLIEHRFYLPLLRNIRLKGKLMMAPVALFILSVPAAIVYIYYDLSGTESLKLLSSLFITIAAVFFMASLIVVTLPSMATFYHLYEEGSGRKGIAKSITRNAIITIGLLTLIVSLLITIAGFDISELVLLFPLLALVIILFVIVIAADFRHTMLTKITEDHLITDDSDTKNKDAGTGAGFRGVLLFTDHYMDLVSGRMEYLCNQADDNYARMVVSYAGKTFDPALLPALKTIVSGIRFSNELKQEAAGVINNIERYYADPARNSDLLRLPAISDKIASARSIMLAARKPQTQEIIKLLNDLNPEIRKAGLTAAAKYDMHELREEILHALSNPETARDAYYVLCQFGPETYSDIIGTAIKPDNSERENLLIIRLIEMMPLKDSIPYLSGFISGGHISVRMKAADLLCRHGYEPRGKFRQMIEDILDDNINIIARLIALQREAEKHKYFVLASAIRQEREVHNRFIYSLLILLVGRNAAEMITSRLKGCFRCNTGIASEAIDALFDSEPGRPLKALFGNSTDSTRLAELSYCYPVREIKGGLLSSFILASEQNITGTWIKACALHKVADEGMGIEKELAVSYLFSNNILLQEESARAICAINPAWYADVRSRLPGQARILTGNVINGTLLHPAMIFEKTRFLSLCFKNVPEEKMMLLAMAMGYSETCDAGTNPDVISWIVPSEERRSGLYSLPISDMAAFIFHYPEYTDIFVNYMNNQGNETDY